MDHTVAGTQHQVYTRTCTRMAADFRDYLHRLVATRFHADYARAAVGSSAQGNTRHAHEKKGNTCIQYHGGAL